MPPIFTPAPLNCRGVFFAVRCRCSSSPIRQSRRFYRVHSALTSSTANRARIPCVSRLFTPLSAFLTSPAGNHKSIIHASGNNGTEVVRRVTRIGIRAPDYLSLRTIRIPLFESTLHQTYVTKTIRGMTQHPHYLQFCEEFSVLEIGSVSDFTKS